VNTPRALTICLIGIGAVVALVMIVLHRPLIDQIGEKPFEVLLQFVLTVIVGGGVALAIERFNRQQDEREKTRTTLREFRAETLGAYNRVKAARRILRAHAQNSGHERIPQDIYDSQLRMLIDAQLALEAVARTSKHDHRLFGSSSQIHELLSGMEKYVNKIVCEYEKEYRNFGGQPAELPLSALQKLDDFIKPSDQSIWFEKKFSAPFQTVLDALAVMIAADGPVPATASKSSPAPTSATG
jgi:hypothetical protein